MWAPLTYSDFRDFPHDELEKCSLRFAPETKRPHACMTDLLHPAVPGVESVLCLSLGSEVGNVLQVV